MANLLPSIDFIDTVKKLKSNIKNIKVAEIGVDRGATTREIIKILSYGDVLDLYDFSNCTLVSDLENIKLLSECEINFYGNTRALYDSYSWTLAKKYLQLFESGQDTKIYDAVYLDGAHTFHVDAPTACVVKELVKINGYIVFDDMYWNLANSPTCNTAENRNNFNTEQFNEPHVKLLVEVLMRSDNRYEEISDSDATRAIFKRSK